MTAPSEPLLPVDVPLTADLVRGALELERTEHGVVPHRLPAWARAQCDDPQLAMAESQPSGVRLVLRTRATAVELDVRRTVVRYTGAPDRPPSPFDLLVDGEPAGQAVADGGTVLHVDMTTGARRTEPGPASTIRFTGLAGRDKQVEIWLPHQETTELLALRADAPVAPVAPNGRRVWLHHGSSISHGSNAPGPSSTWPALAAARGGADLINLGFSGSALLDPFTARTMRETSADLISVKIGINVVGADLMRRRAFGPAVEGFLDTLREGHPDVPLLVVSPVLCPMHEHTPGPGAPDFRDGRVQFVALGDPGEVWAGKLTLTVIRSELERIVRRRAAQDPHLSYLDGRDLYGESDHDVHPLPDALHPDAAGQRLIGERFAAHAFGPNGPFAPAAPTESSAGVS